MSDAAITIPAPARANTAGGADRVTLRPTRRAVLLFALGIPFAILVIAWSPALWFLPVAYALLALALIGADALLILHHALVRVRVGEPVRLPVGDVGQVRVDLTTPPLRRPTRFTIVLEQTGATELPVPASIRTEDGRVAVALPLRAFRRGRIGMEALWLRWTGALGLVERNWRFELARFVDVVPIMRGMRSAALAVAIKDAQFGIKAQRQQGEGSEFDMLREHVPGLDSRHIDWKRSARHNKLLSKVFRTERNHQIVLAFDTGHLMTEPIDGKTRLDHAIEAGLLLGWISLKSGDLVGSFGFDARIRQFVAPGAGLAYLTRIQQAVARLDYTTEETNFTLGLAELHQRLKRRALVVLFTEFVDTVAAELLLEAVQRIAKRHAVVFVTLQDPLMTELVGAMPDSFMPVARSVIAHDLLRERAIVLERLARMGVHVLDVAVGNLSTGLVNKYLRVKQMGQL